MSGQKGKVRVRGGAFSQLITFDWVAERRVLRQPHILITIDDVFHLFVTICIRWQDLLLLVP